MNNFTYCNPTRLVFGKGTIAELEKLLAPGQRILLTYGQGSIKKNGVYDQVRAALAGQEVLEFGGIEPNPVYETLMRAVDVVRSRQVTFLLAVGGGSVLDGTKFIAAAVPWKGSDPWDILLGAPVPEAVPLGTVLTLPATGSEMNSNSVVSRASTQEKLYFSADAVYPRFAILDPEVTYSLPAKQTRNGIVDAFVHVMEQYATYPANAPLQDRLAESVLQTLVEQGPRALANPRDYDARANVMWCATMALNNLISCGVPQDWATHMIGHEITAFYGLDHAETLAIVLPAVLRYQRAGKADKLEQFARRVWANQAPTREQAIEDGIRATAAFFESLGMPTRLEAYKISPREAAERIQTRFTQRQAVLGEQKDLTPAKVAEIVRSC